ncbi:hypothetical protein HAX54_052437 [Datura stramonium]|uniref:Uncharacterized protein n=1 Tax=Datura stramonium TaxID=4076 RepID=A0ABS8WRC8_DATST|nr:hypothetical protein [Datura stramonium]
MDICSGVLRASWTQHALNGCGDFLIADSEIFGYMDCCTSVAASPICSYVWLLVDIASIKRDEVERSESYVLLMCDGVGCLFGQDQGPVDAEMLKQPHSEASDDWFTPLFHFYDIKKKLTYKA